MPQSTGEYRLEARARADVKGVWAYSRRQWGRTQARRYHNRLASAFQFLAENPQAAPACDDIREGYRCHHVGKHMVYYRETDYGVEVMRVLHERMSTAGRFSG